MSRASETLAPRGWRAHVSPVTAIALYGAVLAALALALFVVVAARHRDRSSSRTFRGGRSLSAGWSLSACVVHLHFRRSAHSFSLADVPFVFGLAFASGDGFLAGALLGAGAAYALRKLPPIKLAFNLAQLALAVCVAFVIVRAIAVEGDAIEPRTWIALYVATLATGALTIACIAGAIAIAEGGMSWATLRQMFVMDGVVTAANSSIAIAAAVLIATDARAVIVLLVPAAIVFGVYRAYVSERQRHEKLEFLYEANRALTRSPEVAEAIEGVLARSLEAFRSEIAEVVLFSADGTPLRTTYGPGDERVTMVEADRGAAEELAALIDPENAVVSLVPPYPSERLREHLEQRQIRHAMVAMLPGENRMIGTIMLANRFGIERGYSVEDQRLLEVLANNASVALQYDRLEQAVIKLAGAAGAAPPPGLPRPADASCPTGCCSWSASRTSWRTTAARSACCSSTSTTSRSSTTRSGTASATRCSSSVAGRLRHSVRPQDVVARLGGDEFAVMLPDVEDPAAELRAVATRVLRAFEAPVQRRQRARRRPSQRRHRRQPPQRATPTS